MKGRIIIVALLVLIMASLSFGQLFKYPVTRAGAAIGDVVTATGTLAAYGGDGGTINAYGIVVQIDGDDMLVASSGLFPYAGAAGTMYTTQTGTLVDRSTLSADVQWPVVAVQMTATAAMVVLNTYQARETEYTFATVTTGEPGFLGVVGSDPKNVQDALDAINDYLEDLSATLFVWNQTAGPTNLTGAYATVASVTHTPTAAVPAIAIGDDLFITFTGTFDDMNGVSGAHVQIQLYDGTSAVGSVHEIYLLDRDYHQTESFSTTLRITSAVASNTWSVRAQQVTPYDSGRFVIGQMTLERF